MPTSSPTPITRLLRRYEVLHRIGLGRSRLYDLVAQGKFPAPVRISDRAVAWREDEVDAWIASRPRTRASNGTSSTEMTP